VRALLVIVAAAVLLRWGLRAWVNLPTREFPRDGEHAPRSIYENRSRR
jgi:hypothetical protein